MRIALLATATIGLALQVARADTVACSSDQNSAHLSIKNTILVTDSCATALNIDPTTYWYTALQQVDTSTTNTYSTNYCQSTCLDQTTSVQTQFEECTDEFGRNDVASIQNIIDQCNALNTAETTTAAPETTTAEPETTTAAPETTTAAPDTTTVEPETTTAAPETTTAEPETTTAAPETTTVAVPGTTTVPITTTGLVMTTTSSAPSTTKKSPPATTGREPSTPGARTPLVTPSTTEKTKPIPSSTTVPDRTPFIPTTSRPDGNNTDTPATTRVVSSASAIGSAVFSLLVATLLAL